MGIFLAVLILITAGSVYGFFYLTGEPIPTSFQSAEELLIYKQDAPTQTFKKSSSAPPTKTVVLAGTQSLLFEFRKEDYLNAVESKKIILIYTTTNLCFICRNEVDIVKEIFNETPSVNVTGFRLNLSNNGKDAFQKKLASTFDISSENTKVFIRNNVRLLKSTEIWTKDRYLLEFGNLPKN